MTTSRFGALLAVLVLTAGTLGAQSHPKELAWAVAEFAGDDSWSVRLPQLLVRNLEALEDHRLTASESEFLRQRFLDATLANLERQRASALVATDKRRLSGPLSAADQQAADKALAALDLQITQARAGTVAADPPASLPLRLVWPAAKTSQPWPAASSPEVALASQAIWVVNGTVKAIGSALTVHVDLYSNWDGQVVAHWDGVFPAEEAAQKMVEASDGLREALWGRPWAGLSLEGTEGGTKVKVNSAWHTLPWSSKLLEPGGITLVISRVREGDETRTVTLEAGRTKQVSVAAPVAVQDRLVLATDPPGALLYIDSRYLGPSPQTIDRPRARTRVRAEVVGQDSVSWEIGPDTPSPSVRSVTAAPPKKDVAAAKDRFYWSLAVFSASLTSTSFLAAWTSEQVKLANAYALNNAIPGYNTAVDRYHGVAALYGTGVVLTSGVFVWMMFELGDYLATAQASLP